MSVQETTAAFAAPAKPLSHEGPCVYNPEGQHSCRFELVMMYNYFLEVSIHVRRQALGQSDGISTQQDGPLAGADDKAGRDDLDLTALRQTPGFMIRILQLQIFEEFFAFFASLGLSPAEHSILMVVHDNPSVTQTEVAGALKIQLPNLVKILAKLEAAGLLKRGRSLRDKRAVELSLTPDGRQTAEDAAKQGLAFNAQVLSALTAREQDQFLAMLTRLVAAHANGQDRNPA